MAAEAARVKAEQEAAAEAARVKAEQEAAAEAARLQLLVEEAHPRKTIYDAGYKDDGYEGPEAAAETEAAKAARLQADQDATWRRLREKAGAAPVEDDVYRTALTRYLRNRYPKTSKRVANFRKGGAKNARKPRRKTNKRKTNRKKTNKRKITNYHLSQINLS